MLRAATLLAPLLLLAAACASPAAPRWDPDSGLPRPAQVRLHVAGRAQARSLSCESRSACDLLAHYGIDVGEDAFRLGMPRSDNPDLGFVGDVDGPGEQLPPAGYGVHAGPVAQRLVESGLPAVAVRGRDLAWLKGELARGKPVIVWATSQLDAPVPVVMRDGTGRTFRAVRGEHTYLAIGYGAGTLRLIDAASGREKQPFERTFDASWAALGRQAIVPAAPPARRGP